MKLKIDDFNAMRSDIRAILEPCDPALAHAARVFGGCCYGALVGSKSEASKDSILAVP